MTDSTICSVCPLRPQIKASNIQDRGRLAEMDELHVSGSVFPVGSSSCLEYSKQVHKAFISWRATPSMYCSIFLVLPSMSLPSPALWYAISSVHCHSTPGGLPREGAEDVGASEPCVKVLSIFPAGWAFPCSVCNRLRCARLITSLHTPILKCFLKVLIKDLELWQVLTQR